MSLLLLLVACESTAPSGHPFAPVAAVEPAVPPANAAADPRFDPPAEPFKISSEELAAKAPVAGEPGTEPGDLAPSDAAIAAAVPTPAAADVAAPPPAPLLAELAPHTRFPVRLVSTIPQAQPPRAVLGLANGTEVVVSPGSLLADEGLVVMAVMAGRVQLAKVSAAGDHATIESVEFSAQYP